MIFTVFHTSPSYSDELTIIGTRVGVNKLATDNYKKAQKKLA